MESSHAASVVQGTGASRRLRRGQVPGIAHGGTAAPVQIELDHNAVPRRARKPSTPPKRC
jgi:large subunit ribosomal protein L25